MEEGECTRSRDLDLYSEDTERGHFMSKFITAPGKGHTTPMWSSSELGV